MAVAVCSIYLWAVIEHWYFVVLLTLMLRSHTSALQIFLARRDYTQSQRKDTSSCKFLARRRDWPDRKITWSQEILVGILSLFGKSKPFVLVSTIELIEVLQIYHFNVKFRSVSNPSQIKTLLHSREPYLEKKSWPTSTVDQPVVIVWNTWILKQTIWARVLFWCALKLNPLPLLSLLSLHE